MSSAVTQVINASGAYAAPTPAWFPEHAEKGAEVVTVVSVLGAQASGKSTLLNNLFGTSFEVAARASVANATTKGIFAACSTKDVLSIALDVEGSDSRERGKDGRVFQARCAGFATAISDVLLLNLWYHDVGRFDAAGYALLEAIFAEAVKTSEQDLGNFKTALVFVVRDVDDDVDKAALEQVLLQDATEAFQKTTKGPKIEDLFQIEVVPLPHMRHRQQEFEAACAELASRLTDSTAAGYLAKTEFSKSIPADGCGTVTESMWSSYYATSRAVPSVGEVPLEGGDSSLVAAFKCDEAFSEALVAASEKMSEFSGGSLGEGEKIEGYGSKAAEIMNEALGRYDTATEEYADEAIRSRKRRELESIIDTSQQAIFMRQIQVLRENALAQFKSATSSDDMPSDFAFFTADSLFQREAEESKRPGSSWSSKQERNDLQNMMQEISTQRKRLMSVQVSAAQQQARAMQFLQMQQSQMNAIQAQAYGGGAGQWNVGAAYRPPDTNINASLSYQQGRTNIQISMVPDESASLLGPNGFTAGVGPGNLGLSFNIGL